MRNDLDFEVILVDDGGEGLKKALMFLLEYYEEHVRPHDQSPAA